MFAMMEFIKSKMGVYVIFSIILAFFYLYNITLKVRVDSLKNKLEKCSILIKQQNEAVLNLKEVYDEQLKKQEQLEENIQKEKNKQLEQLKEIEKLKVPTDCEKAIKWGVEHSDFQE